MKNVYGGSEYVKGTTSTASAREDRLKYCRKMKETVAEPRDRRLEWDAGINSERPR